MSDVCLWILDITYKNYATTPPLPPTQKIMKLNIEVLMSFWGVIEIVTPDPKVEWVSDILEG